eukprot:TRINITY_DN3378_c0_g1_i1.p1 TRINITY_DN3378_c0_g1~~TRINITY_DN3378_c0_g1_i1.p1  ORF type:complete len:207 (+),score=42.10 TRINITY_DN3378_c0_g1_i1:66-623(+)
MKLKQLVHNLTGHLEWVWSVVQLIHWRDCKNTGQQHVIIASASEDTTIKLWNATMGYCIHVFNEHTSGVRALVEMFDGTLLSGSWDKTIMEWDYEEEEDDCISRCSLPMSITVMKQMRDGSLVIGGSGNRGEIEIRRTWLSQEAHLVELCCKTIAKHHLEFDMISLEQTLPSELVKLIVKLIDNK